MLRDIPECDILHVIRDFGFVFASSVDASRTCSKYGFYKDVTIYVDIKYNDEIYSFREYIIRIDGGKNTDHVLNECVDKISRLLYIEIIQIHSLEDWITFLRTLNESLPTTSYDIPGLPPSYAPYINKEPYYMVMCIPRLGYLSPMKEGVEQWVIDMFERIFTDEW